MELEWLVRCDDSLVFLSWRYYEAGRQAGWTVHDEGGGGGGTRQDMFLCVMIVLIVGHSTGLF